MKTIIDYTNQVKAYAAAAKSIAPVENGTTASGSYAIGVNFMRDGVLYKAKTAITAGDTLTLGTNYELADPESTQIGQLSSGIQALTNQVEGNWFSGGKNLYPLTLSAIKAANTAGTWSDNVYTRFDVTFEVMQEHGAVTGIKVNGTNAESSNISLQLPATPALNGSYTINGCPSDGSASTFWMRIGIGGSSSFVGNDTGEGKDVNISNATCDLMILLGPSATATNKIFKPMIRDASITDPTYQPYAKPNVELTANISGYNQRIRVSSSITTIRDMIANVLTQSESLLDVYGCFLGDIEWAGQGYYLAFIRREGSNVTHALIVGGSKVYTGTNINSSLSSAYVFEGTSIL